MGALIYQVGSEAHTHIGCYGGAAVPDEQKEQSTLCLIWPKVDPDVGLSGILPELVLNLGLLAGRYRG